MEIDFLILSMRLENAPKILGRQKALNSLKHGLPRIGCCVRWLTFRMPTNRLMAFALGIARWIGALLRGRILPLQSVLALQGWFRVPSQSALERYKGAWRSRSGGGAVLSVEAGDGRGSASGRRAPPVGAGGTAWPKWLPPGPSHSRNVLIRDNSRIIYVDGVRLAPLGVGLSRRIGGRLLIDFDDLMSRRVGRMLRQLEDVSFGAFAGIVPPPIEPLIRALGPMRAVLLSWEKRLLRKAELDAARTADAIAFASAYEARLFRRFQRRYAPDANPTYLLLGPSTAQFEKAVGDTLPHQPPRDLRFIFIGSDLLQQNRIAIEEIVRLSHEGALALPAYIYGRMTRSYRAAENVVFCGFAEDLAQVYQPGSILLMARSVRGGVKSKVLEAFEHGVPTIGTSGALEDFEGPYPWRTDGAALLRLVGDRAALRNGYLDAVAAGTAICKVRFSSRRYWQVLSEYTFGRVRSKPSAGTVTRPGVQGLL